ncbi:MAG TPA: alpha/beta fold hydrolase [Chitinophagaceae bacterium]|nr:alpha/beta fold hydrolase [Chitinophagaceae bacterium]
MKYLPAFLVAVPCLLQIAYSQNKQGYVPRIEACDCPVKVDSNYSNQCGYLIVPENRKKANGKTIKLPFIIAKSNNPDKRKDPLLFTAGGPGGSSLDWITGVGKRGIIDNRDCIAFEQRGTHYAIPDLWSNELSDAIRDSYRNNLSKDSMVLEGVKRYKKALVKKGIDLAGYNTDETVSDIHDLLSVLQIDSVNLFGGSYSGGLMLAVLQKDPSRIRSLILDSPLPTFIPIDEDEPANFNEALQVLFDHCDKDSTNKELYGNLKEKFRQYFSSIENKTFYFPYKEKDATTALNIQYTRSDLLNIVVNAFYDQSHIKDIPYLITQLIGGNHELYIKGMMDQVLHRNIGPSGMRISVYCADQTAYHDEAILKQLYGPYPFMKGYHINDVYREMCDCWQVPPINAQTKKPFYSDKPVLLADGEMDPACRPLYIDMIRHYMPNSQRLLFINRSHMVLGGPVGNAIMKKFLDDPFEKIRRDEKNIIAY